MSNWACEKCQTAKSRCERPSSGGGPCVRCVDRRIECHLTPIKPRRPKSRPSKSNAVLDAKKVQQTKRAAVRERHARRNEFDIPPSADTATQAQAPDVIQAPVMGISRIDDGVPVSSIMQSLDSRSGNPLDALIIAYIHGIQLSAQMPYIAPDFPPTSGGNIDVSSIFNPTSYSATDAGFELDYDTAKESYDTITSFPSPTLTSTSNADAEANYRGAIQANAVHNTLPADPGMPLSYADSLGLGFGAPQNFDVDRPTGGFGYY
ncbi:hypothetical protein EXIGLDRAFT_273087 [Exidia glandulosa HHB12029]|uniref:Zn(2)-C6 fungal-type domain-containing protein n=1 Tax=Exidia glandulosa HHB12029 TaxID=1314781 RepID=A0A165DL03_EXIGL|nr:hypothetical protein EXIGLDRAFT_273087 [Exidia glandulosa HHB12029]